MAVKNSAVKEVENCVSDVMLALVTISQEPMAQQEFEAEFLLPECEKLQEMVSNRIPTSLADEATNQLISFVVSSYKNLENSYCRNDRKKEMKRKCKRYLDVQDMYPTIKRKSALCKKRINFCREIALQIGCAIFHPSTTQLEFCCSNMSKKPTFSGFLNLYLDRLLRMGKNLTKLVLGKQLSRKVVFDNLPRLKKLETFSFSDANDEILETLSGSCSILKHLDITDSRHVTDKSIDHITELKCLRSLKIDGTSITENGLTYILANLPYDQDADDGLECLHAVLSPSQINILACRYPNLKSLEVYLSEYCDISPLKELRNLKNLNLLAGIDLEKSFAPITPPPSPVSSIGCR